MQRAARFKQFTAGFLQTTSARETQGQWVDLTNARRIAQLTGENIFVATAS